MKARTSCLIALAILAGWPALVMGVEMEPLLLIEPGKENPRNSEGNPDGWYCYTAITFVGNPVLLAYCAGDKEIGGLNRLKVLALSRDWLTSVALE